ncbi:MAG: hypothetical protein EPO40_30050 [Myxococcaceae bacterium]|nr:MAG: hypothetical protein EPO40_30050 [Myxococcaceae bacterium]
MTDDRWNALSAVVDSLASLADSAGVSHERRRRIRALERAVEQRNPDLFQVALDGSATAAPTEVDDELPDIAIWSVAEAACSLAEGEGVEVLEGATLTLEAWAAEVRD